MTLHIKSDNVKFVDSDINEPKVHLLPCTIRANGEAKVSKYFEPVIEKKEGGYFTASFRGYPLMGQQLEIPEGYHGFALYEPKEKLSEECDRTLYISEVFKKINYWNYDKVPTVNDGIRNALNWITLAKAIHSPVPSS